MQQVGKQGDSEMDYASSRFGTFQMEPYYVKPTIETTPISNINESHINQVILVTGHAHNIRKTGKQAFVIIREGIDTVQSIAFINEKVSKPMIQFIGAIPKESIVNVTGLVKAVGKPISGCSIQTMEIEIQELFVVHYAVNKLPLQIEDANRPETSESQVTVNLDTRLDHRILDMRTQTSQAIFRIQDAVLEQFPRFLRSRGFLQVVAPCMISAASEGGANVFQVKYFDKPAFLAQSPQLYKQMAVAGGHGRVFCVGPVFRAENSNTHRHLTEFTGLDLEMRLHRHYHEALATACETLLHIFEHLETALATEIATVHRHWDHVEPFRFVRPAPVLEFPEAVAMLRGAGEPMGDLDDLTTAQEKLLGRLVRAKFGTDFFALDKFPLRVRPFYTMPDPLDGRYSNSYDLFVRGEEIMSGAQRIHDFDQLTESARRHGINLDTIRDYLDCFQYAVGPHAGGGIGLERVVMLYLGVDNIRRCSMFPRDPKRLKP